MSRPIYHHGDQNSILSCGRKSLRQDRDSLHGRIRSKQPPSGDKYSVRGGSRLKWNDLWGSSWETLGADGSSNGLTFIQIGHRCCPYCPCCRCCRCCRCCQWGPKNVTPSGTNPTKPSLYRFYSTTLKWNCLIRLIFLCWLTFGVKFLFQASTGGKNAQVFVVELLILKRPCSFE